MLPSGNIAMACGDNVIRILDTVQMSWTVAGALTPDLIPFPPTKAIAEAFVAHVGHRQPPGIPLSVEGVAAQLQAGGTALLGHLLNTWSRFCPYINHLFYSEGHLVLQHHPGNIFGGCSWLHVWKLEGQGENISAQHLYTKDLDKRYLGTAVISDYPPVEDVAVAHDGAFYFLREIQSANDKNLSYLIQSFDVATGNCLATQILWIPQARPGENRPRYTTDYLLIMGDYLVLSRNVEEEGPFPGVGLGVYAFCRTNLSQTSYLPCFEEGEISLNLLHQSGRNGKWILYRLALGEAGVQRRIFIDRDGVLAHDDRQIRFQDREYVMLAGDKEVYVGNPDEDGIIRLDEFDIATGAKNRTIWTGLSTREGRWMLQTVLCNEVNIFCIFWKISGVTTRTHAIRTFLL